MPFCDRDRVAFLKLLGRIYAEMCADGDRGMTTALLRQIWAGAAEGRAWDITSLAADFGLPRQTVSRRLRRLEAAGLIRRVRRGRAARLEPARSFVEADKARLDRLLQETVDLVERLRTRSN